MSELSTAQRNRLPASTFAGPGRSYPIPDASHAIDAKGRATQQFNKGNLSGSERSRIFAMANRKLHEYGGQIHDAAKRK